MDPNATLRDLLEWASAVLADAELTDDSTALDAAERIVGLHEWLSKGGFLPSAWERASK
jgi:hypothetical protein